jgi:DNA-binding NarL/FixJ family response regulator
VRVTVVDRWELFVAVFHHALEQHGYDVRSVVAGQLTTRAAHAAVVRTRPDAVLLGMSLGGADAAELVRLLRRDGHRVVALVERLEPRPLGEALAAGAAAATAKSVPFAVLLDALDKTLHDDPVLQSRGREALIREYEADVAPYANRVARLSRQERDVLAHLMEGHVAAEIARLRGVSEATIRAQVRSVLAKLEVSSQLAAVAVAWRAGRTPNTLHADARD